MMLVAKSFLLAVCFYLVANVDSPIAQGARTPGTPPIPLQLDMRVILEPTAFPSAGRTYLAYELYLTNFSASSITLRGVEVLDADGTAATPIVAFEGEQMVALLQTVGNHTPAALNDPKLNDAPRSDVSTL